MDEYPKKQKEFRFNDGHHFCLW